MNPSTDRQRKLVASRKAQGLKRLELWVTPEEERLLKAYLVEHLRLRNQK